MSGRPGFRDHLENRTIVQRYLSYDYHGSLIKIPFLNIRLIGPTGNKFQTVALVDSGATVTFIPIEMAQYLKIPLEIDSSATGAGGDFPTWITEGIVQILKGTYVLQEMKVEIHVPQEKGKIPYAVLGRNSVFLHYDIIFREREQRMILKRPRGIK